MLWPAFLTPFAGRRWTRAAVSAALAVGCGRHTSAGFTVVRRFPHDTSAYTQGLLYAGGVLFESTGLYGHSEVRRVELATGRVLARVSLPAAQFGEGLALLEGRLYQLTWKAQVGYVYDARTLARVGSFTYRGQGWGLTTDGSSLIMSDGTATLRFLDPRSFRTQREVTVRDGGSPLLWINELEYVRGELFANIYTSNWIVRIDPGTGQVREWLNLGGLLPKRERTPRTDVLNGIACDQDTGDLLVTGKRWPALFELSLQRPPGAVRPN
jgi:glutamine cyclotransferase